MLEQIENYNAIYESGKRVSVPDSVLKIESRNVANVPEDYFDYVMFAWGNCQAEGCNNLTSKAFWHNMGRKNY